VTALSPTEGGKSGSATETPDSKGLKRQEDLPWPRSFYLMAVRNMMLESAPQDLELTGQIAASAQAQS